MAKRVIVATKHHDKTTRSRIMQKELQHQQHKMIKPQGVRWWLKELKQGDHEEQGNDQKN